MPHPNIDIENKRTAVMQAQPIGTSVFQRHVSNDGPFDPSANWIEYPIVRISPQFVWIEYFGRRRRLRRRDFEENGETRLRFGRAHSAVLYSWRPEGDVATSGSQATDAIVKPTADCVASPRFQVGDWIYDAGSWDLVGVITKEDAGVVWGGYLVEYVDIGGNPNTAHEDGLELLACGPPPWGDQAIPRDSFAGALAAAERRGFTHKVEGADETRIDQAIDRALRPPYEPDQECGYKVRADAERRAEIRNGFGDHVCWLKSRGPSIWQWLRSPAL
jgi:hypothetical protein